MAWHRLNAAGRLPLRAHSEQTHPALCTHHQFLCSRDLACAGSSTATPPARMPAKADKYVTKAVNMVRGGVRVRTLTNPIPSRTILPELTVQRSCAAARLCPAHTARSRRTRPCPSCTGAANMSFKTYASGRGRRARSRRRRRRRRRRLRSKRSQRSGRPQSWPFCPRANAYAPIRWRRSRWRRSPSGRGVHRRTSRRPPSWSGCRRTGAPPTGSGSGCKPVLIPSA